MFQPLGIPGVFRWCDPLPYDLPQFKPILAELTAVSCQSSALKTMLHESQGFRKDDQNQVMLLKNLPVIVLTHDPKRWSAPANFAQAQPSWNEMQTELAHLYSNSSLIVAPGSHHDIHVERPELVTKAIRRVYDSAVHKMPIEQPANGGQSQ
jgi:pimeloyl-ACP methyl ester carboxylesterase